MLEPGPSKDRSRALVGLRGYGQNPRQPEPAECPTARCDDGFNGESLALVCLRYREADLDIAIDRAQPDVPL